MHGLVGNFVLNGGIAWQIVDGPFEYHSSKGIFLNFSLQNRFTKRRAEMVVSEALNRNDISWLIRVGREWRLKLDELRTFFDTWKDVDWMTGMISVQPEIEIEQEEIFDEIRERTSVRFLVLLEDIQLANQKRIFLSHKGVDKPLVRRIHNVLMLLGFEPWLDEVDMNAGAELERSLLRGMKDSCAAVFFVTPDYVDENYLATEVDYAIAEKRKKGNQFSIITLVVKKGNFQGAVPELLQKFVWKRPDSELEILTEIIKALPIKVGSVYWRE